MRVLHIRRLGQRRRGVLEGVVEAEDEREGREVQQEVVVRHPPQPGSTPHVPETQDTHAYKDRHGHTHMWTLKQSKSLHQ